jgi:dihydroxyacetone kinase-like protein
MAITVTTLREAAARLAAAASAAESELNTVDGRLGDGDLGITLSAGWNEVVKLGQSMPDDVGLALLAAAKAFQRVCRRHPSVIKLCS